MLTYHRLRYWHSCPYWVWYNIYCSLVSLQAIKKNRNFLTWLILTACPEGCTKCTDSSGTVKCDFGFCTSTATQARTYNGIEGTCPGEYPRSSAFIVANTMPVESLSLLSNEECSHWIQRNLLSHWGLVTHQYGNVLTVCHLGFRAPSQYKDRLIYVWRFPC